LCEFNLASAQFIVVWFACVSLMPMKQFVFCFLWFTADLLIKISVSARHVLHFFSSCIGVFVYHSGVWRLFLANKTVQNLLAHNKTN